MKKILMIMLFLVLISAVSADLTTNLEFYHTFDDTELSGTTYSDLMTNHDGTINAPYTTGISALLEEGINFTKAGDGYMSLANDITFDTTWTLCWANRKTDAAGGGYEAFFRFSNAGGSNYIRHLEYGTDNKFLFTLQDDSSNVCGYEKANTNFVDDDWHFYCLIRNGTTANNDCTDEMYLEVDGVKVAWDTDTGTATVGTLTSSGVGSEKIWGRDNTAGRGSGGFDNLLFYSVDIGSANRDLLYNSGALCNPVDNPTGCAGGAPASVDVGITCTQNLSSYTNSSENPLFFGLDCVGGVDSSASLLFNISLYIDDIINTTIYDFNLNTTILTLNLTYGDEQTGKDINITVTHGEDEANYTTKITDVFLDSVTPHINFLSPAINNSVYYRGFDQFVNLTVYCDDPNLFSCNITLKRVNTTGQFNETLNTTFYDSIATPNQTATIIRSLLGMGNGQYAAIATSADSHTALMIEDYKLNTIKDGYLIDKKVKITSADMTKFSLNKELDRYTFNMDFSKINPEIYVECSDEIVYLPNSKYTGHLVCLADGKWIDFEDDKGTEVSIQRISYNKVRVVPMGKDTKFAFKSIGDLNINVVTYYFNITENNFAFNLYIKDEDEPTRSLVGDAEVEFIYYDGSSPNATYYYADLSGSDNYAINVSSNESLIRGDMYILYSTPNGFTHRYILVNTTFNTTNGYNFTLYNFNTTTDISGLKITARVLTNYNYYTDVIARLQRKYVSEGVWRTVQMDQSGDFGVIYFNIREAEVDYRIIFIDQNNNILKTTDTLKFICTSSLCDLTTLIDPYAAATTTADITAGFAFTNSTKILDFTWINNDGETSTVWMRARQDRASGIIYPCNQTQTAAAGAYSCNLTGYSGLTEITIIGDGNILLNQWITIESAKLGDLIDQREGALWTAFILVVCVGFGIFSPVGAIISSIIGLILVYLLGIFTPLSITFIIIATIIGVVIGFKIRS